MVQEDSERLALGSLHIADVDPETAVATWSANGATALTELRLRYSALETCLRHLNQIAARALSLHSHARVGSGKPRSCFLCRS